MIEKFYLCVQAKPMSFSCTLYPRLKPIHRESHAFTKESDEPFHVIIPIKWYVPECLEEKYVSYVLRSRLGACFFPWSIKK
jgi:hypothetical protein